MVRLKERDSLKDRKGALVSGFNDALLTHLRRQFIAAQPEATRQEAHDAVEELVRLTPDLQTREEQFNARARSGAHRLTNNLRPAPHLSAMRELRHLRDTVIAMDEVLGKRLLYAMEKTPQPPKP